ncbi:MAG: HypC/HybG/HupF family hydrogenase formation chaperone [Bacteroidales bacterium]|jgi:hydrogenase expression/formation protein HypC|nr:HypC/HybG/HupF family hydrogenase formation chaperone [Bacteroidales bacterium]
MCLSIPVRIIEIEGDTARVSAGGTVFTAGLQLVQDAKPGDYVLLHAGFAIQKITDEEASEILSLLDEMEDPDKKQE